MNLATAGPLDPDGWVRRISESELYAKQLAAHQKRKANGEFRRLVVYMNKGGNLVRDEVPGVGVVYRAQHVCTVSPFSAAAVERWCEREGREMPP